MVTNKVAIDEVRRLINTPEVRALVHRIFAGEIDQSEYNKMANLNAKFIVINCLPLSMGQVQKSVVNINMYAPDRNGVPDLAALDEMLINVLPLVEDGFTDKISTEAQPNSLLKDETIRYSLYNLRVGITAENINQNQNNID